jgi:beta-hydroxylase
MFYDCAQFDYTSLLESNWTTILSEYQQVPNECFVAWPEHHLYNFGWNTFGLFALGRQLDDDPVLCPATCDLLAAIPGMVNAGFMRLAAGTVVAPHTGFTDAVLRVHLGLVIPKDCGICVGGETRSWFAGQVLAFDDMVEHSVWNRSAQDRAILLIDVLRPGRNIDITPDALLALETYLRARS